jgi:hypothetical protein
LCSRQRFVIAFLMRTANSIYPFYHPTLARRHQFRLKELAFLIGELSIWDWGSPTHTSLRDSQ